MARERGTIEQAIRKTLHHVAPHKAGLLATSAELGMGDIREMLKYRFEVIEATLGPILKVIARVREAADANDLEGVRAALAEEVEFGHDRPDETG